MRQSDLHRRRRCRGRSEAVAPPRASAVVTSWEFDLVGFLTELERGTTRAQHNDIYE